MNLPAPLASLSERLFAAWRGGAVSLKAVSFALVGLINTAVDAAIFFLLLAYVTPSLASPTSPPGSSRTSVRT